MAFVGVLTDVFGRVTRERRAQLLVAGTFCVGNPRNWRWLWPVSSTIRVIAFCSAMACSACVIAECTPRTGQTLAPHALERVEVHGGGRESEQLRSNGVTGSWPPPGQILQGDVPRWWSTLRTKPAEARAGTSRDKRPFRTLEMRRDDT